MQKNETWRVKHFPKLFKVIAHISFEELQTSEFQQGIEILSHRLSECKNVVRDYVEKSKYSQSVKKFGY